MTVPRRDLAAFLGKKNFKGIYTKNPLATTPAYAKFDRSKIFTSSYPIRGSHRVGARLTNWEQVFSERNVRRTRQPFDNNQFVKCNELIGNDLRAYILKAHENGESSQQISFNLGISVPRVEAVIKLAGIHQKMAQNNEITPEMRKMGNHMRSLFSEIRTDSKGVPLRRVEDLTEIPVPREVQQQRFLSIAESEPFGPVDAANTLDIEPAASTLRRLTEIADHSVEHQQKSRANKPASFYAPQVEGEKARYRFTDAKVGKVGFRYGASRDDRKHARRVTFLPNGNRTYPLPESG